LCVNLKKLLEKDLIAEAEYMKTVFEARHPVISGLIQRSPSITSAIARLRQNFQERFQSKTISRITSDSYQFFYVEPI